MLGRFGGCGGSMFQRVGRLVEVNNFENNPTKGEHRLKRIKQACLLSVELYVDNPAKGIRESIHLSIIFLWLHI